MKRFSLSCLAILSGVAGLACAGPVGSASAVELSGSGVPGAVQAWTDTENFTVGVPFHTSAGIQLGEPTTKVRLRLGSLQHPSFVDGTSAGLTFTFNESAINTTNAKAAAEVTWPVLQWGTTTDYTVTVRLGFTPLETEESCRIRDANGQESGPFHCTLAQRGWDYDWDMHITDDRVHRDVEASGSIKAQGSVSLARGTFKTTSTAQRRPADAVPAASSTQFDAVNKDGEGRDLAYTEFWYGLFDNGQPVYDRFGYPLQVKGTVSNRRLSWFEGGAGCEIRGRDGVDDSSGYSCEWVGDYAQTGIHDGRVHYFADFTVSKKK